MNWCICVVMSDLGMCCRLLVRFMLSNDIHLLDLQWLSAFASVLFSFGSVVTISGHCRWEAKTLTKKSLWERVCLPGWCVKRWPPHSTCADHRKAEGTDGLWEYMAPCGTFTCIEPCIQITGPYTKSSTWILHQFHYWTRGFMERDVLGM